MRVLRLLYRIFLLCGILGALLLAYGHWVECGWIERTDIEVECTGGKVVAPIKLVVLSDIHAAPGDGAYLDKIVARTLAEKPDAVLLLGDYLNGHDPSQGMEPKEFIRHMEPLSAVPMFAVLGNHDDYHGEWRVRAMLRELGANIVQSRADGIPLRLEGQGGSCVDIGGIRCLYTYSSPGTVPQPQGDVPLILLSHSPVGAQYAAPGTTLVVCGHSHGGQVCWPWGRAIYMADGKTPTSYDRGWKTIGGHRTYITRGLGTSILPLRLFCRPEITVITLRGASGR